MSVSGGSIQKQKQKTRVRIGRRTLAVIAIALAASVGLTAFALYPRPDVVRIDGSSTVFPITVAWAQNFSSGQRQVVVGFVGTGAGFQKFCRGETDLNDASRPIRQSEIDACTQGGVTGIVEFLVAYDGVSVVVNKNNLWAQNLTVRELCRIWTSNVSSGACGGAGPRVTTWIELNPTWPNRAINLYGPGTDSGTFDYFVEVILDPFGAEITRDFFPSENDNTLVQAVASDLGGLGYFGYAYVVANVDRLNLLEIDDGNPANGVGPIAPSEATIRDGTYAPLSRPLFVYANEKSLARQIVRDFLRFGYSPQGVQLVTAAGYVSLNPSELLAQLAKIPSP